MCAKQELVRTAFVLGRQGDMWGTGSNKLLAMVQVLLPSVTCETQAAGTPYPKGLLSEEV